MPYTAVPALLVWGFGQVEFMWRRIRHYERPKGAILADDMGLGKTVQIIALLTALLKKTGAQHDVIHECFIRNYCIPLHK